MVFPLSRKRNDLKPILIKCHVERGRERLRIEIKNSVSTALDMTLRNET